MVYSVGQSLLMNITINIPSDIEQRLQAHLGSLSQKALEAIAVEAYRSKLINAAEVQRMLQLPSRLATDALLKEHGAYLHYTEADIEQDLKAIDRALAQS
jgi:predicted HTH domain antitoxin